jgi:hypothetical protein
MMGKILMGTYKIYDGHLQIYDGHLQIYDGHLQDAGNAQICAGFLDALSFLRQYFIKN